MQYIIEISKRGKLRLKVLAPIICPNCGGTGHTSDWWDENGKYRCFDCGLDTSIFFTNVVEIVGASPETVAKAKTEIERVQKHQKHLHYLVTGVSREGVM